MKYIFVFCPYALSTCRSVLLTVRCDIRAPPFQGLLRFVPFRFVPFRCRCRFVSISRGWFRLVSFGSVSCRLVCRFRSFSFRLSFPFCFVFFVVAFRFAFFGFTIPRHQCCCCCCCCFLFFIFFYFVCHLFSGTMSTAVRVLFADVEGQGDRDAAYDARLASAILPLTKCVIFNWRDSLQVDRMLNLLGVMQRAAHNVDLGKLAARLSSLLVWGGRGSGCVLIIMHGRSRMNIDPRIPMIQCRHGARSPSGFHRPSRHLLAPSAKVRAAPY